MTKSDKYDTCSTTNCASIASIVASRHPVMYSPVGAQTPGAVYRRQQDAGGVNVCGTQSRGATTPQHSILDWYSSHIRATVLSDLYLNNENFDG